MPHTGDERDPATHPIRWWLGGLVEFRDAPAARWPVALQAAAAIAIPVALFTILGRPEVGFQAAAGAFTAIYGGSWTATERARALPLVAAGLIVCAALGVVAAPYPVVVLVGLVVVSVLSAGVAYGFSLGPPGPIFFALVYGLSAHVTGVVDPTSGARLVEPPAFLGAFVLGCAIAYAATLVPLVAPSVRRRPARGIRLLLPGPRFDSDAIVLVVRVALVAVVGALVAALWVDPQHAYWVVCTGIAVIGVNVGRRAAVVRGTQRLVGTIAGAALFAGLAALPIPPLVLPLLLGGLQFAIEMLVVRNYALALVFITPLVLFITTAASGADASALVSARVLDTLVGAVLGVLTGFLHPPHARTPRLTPRG